MPPELRGSRLDLRPLAAADEELYCAVYTDTGLMRHVGEPLSVAAARRAFAATLQLNASRSWVPGYWVIVDRQASAHIGLAGLIRGATNLEAELGILILPAWQGRGYAAETLRLLIDQAYSATSLTCLHARHAAGNGAMVSVLARLRFVRTLPDADLSLGCRWELSREDWLRL